MRRCRRATSTKSGSRFAAHTATPWLIIQNTRPANQRRSPNPSAAARVPFRIAIARGAPPRRIGSERDRCRRV